jgi:ABC-type nitrate/sulfonate/bicarbonate transport system substrate-binding protein
MDGKTKKVSSFESRVWSWPLRINLRWPLAFVSAALAIFLILSPTDSVGADKLRIGYSGATISNAMLWVTDEGKLFQKNGIDPEILYLQTTLGQTALIAGEIEMCVYSGSLLAVARLQGADVVMVTSFLNKPIYRLVVRPEIRTVADLKGKRLGITRFGTVTDSTTRLLVARLGLDPDKDVILMQIGDVPVLLTSLIAGRTIDGAIIQPPYYQKAVAAGMRILANMQEMDILVQQTGLNTTQKFIAKNPDIVRRAVKSVIEGIHMMRENPAVAKQAIARRMQIRDEKELEDSYQLLRSFIQVKPYPTLEGFKTIFADLAKRVPAAKNADPKDYVDTRFIDELDRSGFIDKLYR